MQFRPMGKMVFGTTGLLVMSLLALGQEPKLLRPVPGSGIIWIMQVRPMRRLVIGGLALTAISLLAPGQEPRHLRPLPDSDRNGKTGPAIGEKIPAFEATDQNGKQQSFETLRGPKGLVLLFARSADW